MAVLGALYTPLYLVQKAALLGGQPMLSAFFWPLASQKLLNACIPLVVPPWRRSILYAVRHATARRIVLTLVVVPSSIAGLFLMTRAFELGLASLVSMTVNTQPFLVLFLGWVFLRLFPGIPARELRDKRSILLKITSFLIVFAGLALIALPQ